MDRTIVALYDDTQTAFTAVDALVRQGISREDISIVGCDPNEEFASYLEDSPGVVSAGDVGAGAGVGALIGAMGGLLLGLSAVVVPGVGPVITAGTIATTLLGAGAGALTGSIVGAMVEAGVPEVEAACYAEGLRRGGSLVIATVPAARASAALDVMNRYNPLDLETEAARWEEEGWEAPFPLGTEAASMEATQEPGMPEELTELASEPPPEVMERRYRSTARIYREGCRIVPEGYEAYEPQFYRHYSTTNTTRRPFGWYKPAYRYGYDLATHPDYAGLEWGEVEAEARQSWEAEHKEPWDEVRDTVIYSWETAYTCPEPQYQ